MIDARAIAALLRPGIKLAMEAPPDPELEAAWDRLSRIPNPMPEDYRELQLIYQRRQRS